MKSARAFTVSLIKRLTGGAYIKCSECQVCAICQKDTWHLYKDSDCYDCMRLRIITDEIKSRDSEHAAALAIAEERYRKAIEEKEAMRIAWHGLINQGKDFYSWQRDWQDAARLILGLGDDASVEDINLALLLRNAANGRES